MSATRMLAVARKEIVQVLRDTRSLIIVLIMPAVLVILFGYGVSLDLKHLPVYVFDRDGSQQSQELLRRFQASRYFQVVGAVDNYRDLVRAIDDGRAKMGIVISWDFSRRLHDGRPVRVQALVDGTDDNTANVLISYAQAVVQGYSSDVELNWLRRRGQAVQRSSVSINTRTWYNEDLESSAFIIPGVLALVMSVIGAFLTSLTIAREWERGTMEQLISTPVTPLEIMVGKLVPYFVLGMIAVVVCSLIARYWFHVPFRGSFITLLVGSAMFMIVVLSMGFVISVVARNQLAASQIALVTTFLPAFILSGFLYAIEQMPVVLQWITRVLPARYYVSLLKKIFLKGTPVTGLYSDLLPLAVFTIVLVVLATRVFHKRLA